MHSIDLKEIRKSCGLSQQEIANFLGIKQQQYSRYETNTTKMAVATLLQILDICGYQFKIIENNQDSNLQKSKIRV